MAGRFEKLRLLHWFAAELAAVFGLPEEKAVQQIVRFGSFPGATALVPTPGRWRDYIRDSISATGGTRKGRLPEQRLSFLLRASRSAGSRP